MSAHFPTWNSLQHLGEDVLRLICDELAVQPDPPSNNIGLFPELSSRRAETTVCRNALISSALSCRAFTRPALDVLWRSLDSFSHFESLAETAEQRPVG